MPETKVVGYGQTTGNEPVVRLRLTDSASGRWWEADFTLIGKSVKSGNESSNCKNSDIPAHNFYTMMQLARSILRQKQDMEKAIEKNRGLRGES